MTLTVLVDGTEILEVVRRALRAAGLDTSLRVVEGDDGLREALNDRWDLAVVTSGLPVVQTLQQFAPGMPIVFVSRTHDPVLALEAVRHGAVDCLDRDSLEDELGPIVRRELKRSAKHGRRILESTEAEVRRVAGELHDQLGQLLAVVRLGLTSLRDEASDRERVEHLISVVDEAVDKTQSFAHDLWPTDLEILGLGPALRALAKRQARLSGVAIDVTGEVAVRTSRQLETACYRITQEAVVNAIRHARATRIEIALAGDDETIEVRVIDDGIGFDLATALAKGGLGLRAMRERAGLAKSKLEIRSGPGGTTVIVRAAVA